MKYPSDIVFTETVKKLQEKNGSRKSYSRMEQYRGWQTKITTGLKQFLQTIDSFYFGTANNLGQPYIQHRGGPAGFLKAIDDNHLAFADFSGNMQYITIGNLEENNKATIFLIDYPTQTRIKIWGTAKVVYDKVLITSLHDSSYKSIPERVIIFKIDTWDINCKQHIKQRFTTEVIEKHTEQLHKKIEELETIIKTLSNNSSHE